MSSPREEAFRKRVYAAVRRIPRGRVATYGQIAATLGHPRSARAVGRALAVIPAAMARTVPWQRVVNAAGSISRRDPEAMALQHDLLLQDGVALRRGGSVDLGRFGWVPPGAPRGATRRVASRIDRARAEDFLEEDEVRTTRRAVPRARAAQGAGRAAR